jgi:AcrR family transcriptional regulator
LIVARPSQQLDQALLDSGRRLYPRLGCEGLSVRTLAADAGVNQAMFHYHFKNKDAFLRVLLQQLYEEMFGALSAAAQQHGAPLQRLSTSLATMARFAREHRRVLARVWTDALSGERVARDFFARNAPRHVGLLFTLLQEAQAAGQLRKVPPLQRFSFVMGSVLLPIIFISGLLESGGGAIAVMPGFDEQVLSDAAIEARIAWAIDALQPAPPRRSVGRRTPARAPRPRSPQRTAPE